MLTLRTEYILLPQGQAENAAKGGRTYWQTVHAAAFGNPEHSFQRRCSMQSRAGAVLSRRLFFRVSGIGHKRGRWKKRQSRSGRSLVLPRPLTGKKRLLHLNKGTEPLAGIIRRADQRLIPQPRRLAGPE